MYNIYDIGLNYNDYKKLFLVVIFCPSDTVADGPNSCFTFHHTIFSPSYVDIKCKHQCNQE